LLCQASSLFTALASPGDTGGFLYEKQLDIATSCRTCILRPCFSLRDSFCSLRSLHMEQPIDFNDLALYAWAVTSFAEK
ncbi:hypothetical protein SFB41_14135, partial [Legionella pneumophila]|nr:hypothetical protein [Legionella pneumophila]